MTPVVWPHFVKYIFSKQSISSLVARCYVLEGTLHRAICKYAMIRPHIPCNFFAIYSMNSFPSLLARCYVAAQAECWSVHGPIWRGQRQRQPGQQPLSSPRSTSEFVKYFHNNMIDGYQTAMCMLYFFKAWKFIIEKRERSEKRRGQSRREIICTLPVVYEYKKSLVEEKSKYQ